MSIIDNIRRRFATVGTDPPFKENEPLDYGAGVIKRIAISRPFMQARAKKYEQHLGKPMIYMNVYLSDPIVRTLIDLPCLYAVKDNFPLISSENVHNWQLLAYMNHYWLLFTFSFFEKMFYN